MNASDLALEIWNRKGQPVEAIWLSAKQASFLDRLMTAEGFGGSQYGRMDMPIVVPGFEDRDCTMFLSFTLSGSASMEIRIRKTEEEARAAHEAHLAEIAAANVSWF